MKMPKQNESVLLRVPSHLHEQVSMLLENSGYYLSGAGQYFKVAIIPYLIQEKNETVQA